MYTALRATQIVLIIFLSLSLLSKTTMPDTILGNTAQKQIARISKGITKDGLTQLAISRQDSEPLIALIHNIEASNCLKLAKRLVEESGGEHHDKYDYIDLLADLTAEREKIMQELLSHYMMIKN